MLRITDSGKTIVLCDICHKLVRSRDGIAVVLGKPINQDIKKLNGPHACYSCLLDLGIETFVKENSRE